VFVHRTAPHRQQAAAANAVQLAMVQCTNYAAFDMVALPEGQRTRENTYFAPPIPMAGSGFT
jgi:hypothetical protein